MIATSNGAIYLEGVDEVLRSLANAGREVREAALKAVEQEGMAMTATAVQNLRDNGTWKNTTGTLANSARVERVRDMTDGMDSVEVGFFEKTKDTGYAEYVEFGRPPGKLPPLDSIRAWAYKKFQLHDWDLADSIGFLVAWKIAWHGSRPHPFFTPAVQLHQPRLLARIKAAVEKVTRNNNA